MKIRHAVPLALTLVLLLSAADCEDTTAIVPVPSEILVVSGNGQEAVVGTALASPVVVQVLDQDDDPMAGVVVGWATPSGSIVAGTATDASGETSGEWTLGTAAGSVAATASIEGGIQATVNATALPGPVAELAASADSLAFAALGETATVTAAGVDAHGNAVSTVDVTWLSRDTLVASVSAGGTVTARGDGTTYVVGQSDAASDSVRVRVAQTAASVTVTPDSATLIVGETAQFTATAADANGHALASPSFTWGSSLDAVATVDGTGLVTAQARGTTAISAALGEVLDTVQVRVESDTGEVANPVCPAGSDPALVGEWAANELFSNGHDDISAGNSLLVSLRADSTGRLIERVPSGFMGDETMATDSAHFDWVGCSGQLTVTFGQQWIESVDGSYDSEEMDYGVRGDTLDLVMEAGTDYGTFVSVSTGAQDPDLIGHWVLISDVIQNQENVSQEIDVVAEYGGLVRLHLTDDGTLFYSEVESDGLTWKDVGTWSVRGDTIVHYSLNDNEVFPLPYSKPAADRFVFQRDDPEGWDFDDDGTEEPIHETGTFARPDTAGLVGTWVADSYTVTSVADTTQSVDLIAQGFAVEITFTAQGEFDNTVTTPDGPEVMTGTYAAAGGYLWLQEVDYLDFLGISYTATTATVTGSQYYDFDGDGVEEAGTMVVVLTRQ